MALSQWIKECSSLLKSSSSRSSRRRASLGRSRRHQSVELSHARKIRSFSESLEQRVLPANLAWVGDVSPQWNDTSGAVSNWNTATVPQDGDALAFPATSSTMLVNNTSAENSYTLTFLSGGYSISGNSIRLDNAGTDVSNATGTTTLQLPLIVEASTFDVTAGLLDVQGPVSGTLGLTKSGDGTLALNAAASFTGPTHVQDGALLVNSTFLSTDLLTVDAGALLGGSGSLSGPASVSGILAPGDGIGTLSTQDVTLTRSATLQLQIGGTATGQFDQVTVNGTLQLDGTLQVSLEPGFTPAAGDLFPVLSATTLTGRFDQLSGLTYSGGALLPIQTPTGLLLVATPFPTGAVSLAVDSTEMANALADFFKTGSGSVSVTGDVTFLEQSISGTLAFSRQTAADGSSIITIAVSSAAMTLTGSSGSLVDFSGGSGVLVLTNSGFGAQVTGSLSESVATLSISGTYALAVNTSATAISETLTVNGVPVTVSLPAGPYVRLSADNAVVTTSVLDLTGSVTLETTGSGALREIVFGATGAAALFGDAGDNGTSSDDVGVRLTGGTLTAVILSNGTFALDASGTTTLVGVPGLSLTGTGGAEINTTGSSVTRTVQVGGATRTLSVAAGVQRFAARNVAGQFTDFVQVSGDFLVEKSVTGGVTTLRAGASGLNAFLGVNYDTASEFGVRLNNAGFGLVIEKETGLNPKFAVQTLGGSVSLTGLPDLDLTGPLALDINQLGKAIEVSVPTLSGGSVPLDFDVAESVRQFGGSLDLGVSGFTKLSGNFAFAKEQVGGTTKIKVGGTEIFAFLGQDPNGVPQSGDEVGAQISGGRLGAAFYKTGSTTTYAIDASGTAAMVGVSGVTFAGTLAARVNTTGGAVNETIEMTSGSPVVVAFGATESAPVFKGTVTAVASGFASISGGLSISKSGSQLQVAASDVTAFVGAGGTGVRVTDGTLAAIINTTSAKYAIVASGTTALEGVSGLTVTGTGSLRMNTLGEAINQTITTPDGDVAVEFTTSADVMQIRSNLRLQFQNFVQASGDFLIDKTTTGDLTTLKLGASNLNAFLGVNYGQAGEFGVKVTGAGVAMLVEKDGANAAKYAISTTGGTVGLVGLAGVDLTGPLALNINKLGRAIDVSLPAPSGVTFPLKFTAPDAVQRFAGDVNLSIAGFTTLTGTYVFEKDTDNGTTEIRVAGTNINAILGSNPDGVIGTSDDVGAKITNARLGAVLYRTSAGATSYAVDAKGTASLVGVDGFTLTGDLAARVNTTGGAVSETITMPSGDPVVVAFGATEAAAVFSGTVTAEVSSFATVTGAFAVSKNGDLLTVAAAGVTAFVGSGDLGVRVTNGKLGVVVKTDTKKFAAVASGSAALEGVSGLTVTGTGSVRINQLDETIDQTITTPGGDVRVKFDSSVDVFQVQSTLNLQFESFVQASGDFLIEKTTTGDLTTLTLAASNLDAFLGVNYNAAGEFGVKVTGAGVAMLIEKDGLNAAKYAISTIGGTVGLVGLPGVDLTGPLALNINKLGRAVDVSLPAPSGVTFPLKFTAPDPVQRFAGDVNLSIAGFTTLTGTYVFEKDTDNGTTEIRVAGTNINGVRSAHRAVRAMKSRGLFKA